MSTRTRRVKWHPTPPSPKIINLPRKTSKRQPKTSITKQPTKVLGVLGSQNYKGNLENLFDKEREFTRTVPVVLLNSCQKRERVVVEERESGGGEFAEEKWRFQAEILRAECNFLRLERKFALKKLERNRAKMERTLRSAVHNLALGRKKISEGKNMEVVLEEEIKDLEEKLEELQRSSGVKDHELRKCQNFDKKASRLQQRLVKLGGLSLDEQRIKGMAESSLSACKAQNISTDNLQVEKLERNLEGLSKGMLDRMEEECGSILSTTANSSIASSASSSKRIDLLNSSSLSTRPPNQESMSHEENKCSGRCKALVKRIVEQVRAETEQWSQMQEMLAQLRAEMEELQTSRDFWENQALASTTEIQSLKSSVGEWREKAITFETKANEIQTQVSSMKGELEKLRKEQLTKSEVSTPKKMTSISLGKQIEKEKHMLICRVKGNCDKGSRHNEIVSEKSSIEELNRETKDVQPISLGKQLAREKRIMISQLKENRQVNDKSSNHEISSREKEGGERERRKANACNNGLVTASTWLPFREIGNSNSSPVSVRHNSNAIFPLHCPEHGKIGDKF